MGSKTFSSLLVLYLIGSTLCVIPEGEYQFGPVFGHAPARFFGHKYFEAFLDKGQIKPLLAKKVLLGAGAVGAVAAVGGAALLAKKIHESKGFGHGGGNHGGWYPPTQNHYQQHGGSGWYSPSTYQGSSGGWSSSSSSEEYGQGGYGGKVSYPGSTATQFHYQSSPSQDGSYGTGYEDNSAGGYDYGQGQSNGYYGWSR